MDEWHLNAARARTVVDLGCGTGKVCMQAFLEYKSLHDLFGVEISKPRYDIAEIALLRLAATFPEEYTVLTYQQGRTITVGAPLTRSHLRGHARLDAAGLLHSLTGECVSSAAGGSSPGSESQATPLDMLHPADQGRPRTSEHRNSDEEHSPFLGGQSASIHIPPNLGSAPTNSTGGSSMSQAGAQPSTQPSALGKLARAHEQRVGLAHAPFTCSPASHCAVEYDPAQWRTMRVAWGDMFDTCHVDTADLICIETDVPGACYPLLAAFVRSAKKGARVLSYLNLAEVWPAEMRRFFNLEQLAINRSVYDRFWTSWSYVNGHKFYLWQCVRSPLPLQVDVKRHRDGTTHVLVTVPPSSSSIVGGPLIRKIGTGFAAAVADPSMWKVIIPPPTWTWDDVCDIHGAGRRPRLLAFGGLLNNFGGHLDHHEDDLITFTCLRLPNAPPSLLQGANGDVPQPSSTSPSVHGMPDAHTMESELVSRQSTASSDSHDSERSASHFTEQSTASAGNPMFSYAVSSVRDLDAAQDDLFPGRREPQPPPVQSKLPEYSRSWSQHGPLPGTPDEDNSRPAHAFQQPALRTVHSER
jgi:hypothetical protein